MTSPDILPNAQVRQHFLDRHQLRKPPLGTRLDQTLTGLNFVQVDSINTLARAHDLILWSRQQSYRPPALRKMVDHSRQAFEAWTHDASILPMAAFPHWRHKFIRDQKQVQKRWKAWHRGDFLAQTETVLEQIARHGPLGSGDVGAQEQRGTGGWWDWHPSKTALEYLWRTGRITVSRREGFRKLYDLTENVIPQEISSAQPSFDESLDWACTGALRALGFATAKEISDFYDFVTASEARAWIARGLRSGALREIKTEAANGQLRDRVIFTQDWPSLQEPLAVSNRLRILSPFDPALRNRARAEEIFGFSYRIEVFVPAARRQYGYYVFPILEGSALIARIEIKANRKKNKLEIIGFWPEAKVKFSAARTERLIAELKRICLLVECRDISGIEILRRM